MESRFSKYKSEGKAVQSHIANVNSYIDYNYKVGLDLIEGEINDLQSRIDAGGAPPMFQKKVDLLIKLGEAIENVHEAYHFNKEQAA